MPKTVTFSGERVGETLTVRHLIATLEGALAWLRGHDPDTVMDWSIVKIKLAKAISITLSSESANGEISARFKNLHQLQAKKLPKLLPRLSDEDIEGTRELADVLKSGLSSLRISSAGEPTVKVTSTLIERVELVAEQTREKWFEYTSLRGVVDQITVLGNSAKFRFKHQLTGTEINCSFAMSEMSRIKDALSKRVEVYGRVRYNRSDRPTSIEMESMRVIEAVAWDDLPAINITDGEDSADFVARLRGGE